MLLGLLCRFVPLRQGTFDDSHSQKYEKFKTNIKISVDLIAVRKLFYQTSTLYSSTKLPLAGKRQYTADTSIPRMTANTGVTTTTESFMVPIRRKSTADASR